MTQMPMQHLKKQTAQGETIPLATLAPWEHGPSDPSSLSLIPAQGPSLALFLPPTCPPQLPPSFLPTGTAKANHLLSALSPLSGKTPECCPLLPSLIPNSFPGHCPESQEASWRTVNSVHMQGLSVHGASG